MSRAAAIRFWMEEHPGWHFASDIADGLASCGLDRTQVIKSLCGMRQTGAVRAAGSPRYMRYTIGRPVRDYKHKEKADG